MTKYPIHPAKRAFDIIFTLVILIILSPLVCLFIVLIFLEHVVRLRPFDPLLYGEIRYSQGKPFMLYKFNIFKHDKVLEMRSRGEFIHTKVLERNGTILYIGWILKQIYLDELPQFFNVLKGDMSIVGPRPVNKEVYDALLKRNIIDKTKVKAGITGYYQSHKHTAGKKSDDLDREYVEYYFSNSGLKIFYFDLKIILRTIKVMLLAKGI